MVDGEAVYLRERMEGELRMVREARCGSSALAHAEMARLYGERLGLGLDLLASAALSLVAMPAACSCASG